MSGVNVVRRCNFDCLNCKYCDCRNEDAPLTASEIRWSDYLDWWILQSRKSTENVKLVCCDGRVTVFGVDMTPYIRYKDRVDLEVYIKARDAAYDLKRYWKNPEKARKSARDRYYRNQEHRKAKSSEYYHTHTDDISKKSAERYYLHKEEINARRRELRRQRKLQDGGTDEKT